ncbi:MAG: hypothetical protein B6D77_09885 [gamma proteobacterium symbiont of Ctena orbiculata]|nr:MAG: hypothetical protein B6D77_09885 [gamma proteobacterium symbiont of Ctena orbiculata]PVV22866.1 MAG: hypothetical protein B6D78_04260 [gamma proteobacterium symbiont of Ctena orbiculata]
MRHWKSYIGLILSVSSILLLLTSCGGSGNSGEPGDSTNDTPSNGDSDNVQIQDPSVLSVSNLRTAANPDIPISVFNDAGDGLAVWAVTSEGTWLYYSLYDCASDSWTSAQRLAEVAHDELYIAPKVVSNGVGFAVAWNTDNRLYINLFNDGEWVTTQANPGATWFDSHELISNGRGYLLAWRQDSGARQWVYTTLSEDGMTWGDTVIHSEAASDNAFSIQVESDGTGYAVIWEESNTRILGNIHDGSAWLGTQELVNLPDSSIFRSRIASNGTGYLLAWTRGGESIMNRIYTPSDGWGLSEVLFPRDSDDNSAHVNAIVSNGTGYCALITKYEEAGQWGLYAAIDSQGNGAWEDTSLLDISRQWGTEQWTLVSDGDGYAAAWGYFDANNDNIVQHTASVYQGTGWHTLSNPISIAPIVSEVLYRYRLHDQLDIEIAGLNGQYVLTSKQVIDDVDSITATRYDSNLGWLDTEILENGSGTAKDPKLSVNQDRGLSVIWHQIDDSGTAISTYRNRMDGEQWSGAELLHESTYLLGSSYTPQLVAADNGTTLALWSQHRNGYRALIANIRDGDAWAQPVVLSDSTTETTPRIASNGTGFAVTWEERSGEEYLLKGVTFERDGWSDSIVHDISVLQYSSKPIPMVLASNGRDYMLLHFDYPSQSNTTGNLIARHFDAIDWREPAMVAEGVYFATRYPKIATNGTTYLTAWLQQGDTMDIYSSQYDGDVWGSGLLVASDLEIILNEYGMSRPDGPELASNGEGYGIFWFDRGNVIGSLYTESWSSPEDIGDINLQAWRGEETPYVASNGSGYAVAWRSDNETGSTLYANVYNATSWIGAEGFSASQNDTFVLPDDGDLLEASGEKYALLWATPYPEVSASVYDGSQWSTTTRLNRVLNETSQFQLASDGMGFLAAWIQDNGSGTHEIVSSSYDNNSWGEPVVVDDNQLSKFDLDLIGDSTGFQAVWTGAEQGGDPWVRIPWAKSGL